MGISDFMISDQFDQKRALTVSLRFFCPWLLSILLSVLFLRRVRWSLHNIPSFIAARPWIPLQHIVFYTRVLTPLAIGFVCMPIVLVLAWGVTLSLEVKPVIAGLVVALLGPAVHFLLAGFGGWRAQSFVFTRGIVLQFALACGCFAGFLLAVSLTKPYSFYVISLCFLTLNLVLVAMGVLTSRHNPSTTTTTTTTKNSDNNASEGASEHPDKDTNTDTLCLSGMLGMFQTSIVPAIEYRTGSHLLSAKIRKVLQKSGVLGHVRCAASQAWEVEEHRNDEVVCSCCAGLCRVVNKILAAVPVLCYLLSVCVLAGYSYIVYRLLKTPDEQGLGGGMERYLAMCTSLGVLYIDALLYLCINNVDKFSLTNMRSQPLVTAFLRVTTGSEQPTAAETTNIRQEAGTLRNASPNDTQDTVSPGVVLILLFLTRISLCSFGRHWFLGHVLCYVIIAVYLTVRTVQYHMRIGGGLRRVRLVDLVLLFARKSLHYAQNDTPSNAAASSGKCSWLFAAFRRPDVLWVVVTVCFGVLTAVVGGVSNVEKVRMFDDEHAQYLFGLAALCLCVCVWPLLWSVGLYIKRKQRMEEGNGANPDKVGTGSNDMPEFMPVLPGKSLLFYLLFVVLAGGLGVFLHLVTESWAVLTVSLFVPCIIGVALGVFAMYSRNGYHWLAHGVPTSPPQPSAARSTERAQPAEERSGVSAPPSNRRGERSDADDGANVIVVEAKHDENNDKIDKENKDSDSGDSKKADDETTTSGADNKSNDDASSNAGDANRVITSENVSGARASFCCGRPREDWLRVGGVLVLLGLLAGFAFALSASFDSSWPGPCVSLGFLSLYAGFIAYMEYSRTVVHSVSVKVVVYAIICVFCLWGALYFPYQYHYEFDEITSAMLWGPYAALGVPAVFFFACGYHWWVFYGQQLTLTWFVLLTWLLSLVLFVAVVVLHCYVALSGGMVALGALVCTLSMLCVYVKYCQAGRIVRTWMKWFVGGGVLIIVTIGVLVGLFASSSFASFVGYSVAWACLAVVFFTYAYLNFRDVSIFIPPSLFPVLRWQTGSTAWRGFNAPLYALFLGFFFVLVWGCVLAVMVTPHYGGIAVVCSTVFIALLSVGYVQGEAARRLQYALRLLPNVPRVRKELILAAAQHALTATRSSLFSTSEADAVRSPAASEGKKPSADAQARSAPPGAAFGDRAAGNNHHHYFKSMFSFPPPPPMPEPSEYDLDSAAHADADLEYLINALWSQWSETTRLQCYEVFVRKRILELRRAAQQQQQQQQERKDFNKAFMDQFTQRQDLYTMFCVMQWQERLISQVINGDSGDGSWEEHNLRAESVLDAKAELLGGGAAFCRPASSDNAGAGGGDVETGLIPATFYPPPNSLQRNWMFRHLMRYTPRIYEDYYACYDNFQRFMVAWIWQLEHTARAQLDSDEAEFRIFLTTQLTPSNPGVANKAAQRDAGGGMSWVRYVTSNGANLSEDEEDDAMDPRFGNYTTIKVQSRPNSPAHSVRNGDKAPRGEALPASAPPSQLTHRFEAVPGTYERESGESDSKRINNTRLADFLSVDQLNAEAPLLSLSQQELMLLFDLYRRFKRNQRARYEAQRQASEFDKDQLKKRKQRFVTANEWRRLQIVMSKHECETLVNELSAGNQFEDDTFDKHTALRGVPGVRAEEVVMKRPPFSKQPHTVFNPQLDTPYDMSTKISQDHVPTRSTAVQWVKGGPAAHRNTVDGFPSPYDIQQGFLGDCYLLSALSVLASRGDRLVASFFPRVVNDKGVYAVRFYRNQTWFYCVIDDRIPCSNNTDKPLFCTDPHLQSGQGSVTLWGMLAEKAYAKLNGGFREIVGGQLSQSLMELCGPRAASEEIALTRDVARNPGDLWSKLQYFQSTGLLMGLHSPASPVEKINEVGIVWGHAYSILKLREVDLQADSVASGSGEEPNANVVRLLQLRNPQGKNEWTGPWSDGSAEWRRYPRIRNQLGGETNEDGVFWMRLEDVITQFSTLYVCRLFDEGWREWSFGAPESHTTSGTSSTDSKQQQNHVGERLFRDGVSPLLRWSQRLGSNGGVPSGTYPAHKNPHLLIQVEQHTDVFVQMTQPAAYDFMDTAEKKQQDQPVGMGMFLLRNEGKRVSAIKSLDGLVAKNPEGMVTGVATISLSCRLKPSDHPYSLVMCSNSDRDEGGFFVKVYTRPSKGTINVSDSSSVVLADPQHVAARVCK